MKQKESQFYNISDVIDNWFKSKNYSKKLKNFNAFNNWDKIVGPDIAKNTEPAKFHKDTLVIKVKNSVWTQELQYLKPQLLKKIRTHFPDANIRDLKFKIGQIKNKTQDS